MILVTGATGYTGSEFLHQYFAGGHTEPIRCLVRPTSDRRQLEKYPIEIVEVPRLDDVPGLRRVLTDVDTVINIANIRFAEPLLAAAEGLSVRRMIFVNTTGVFSEFRELAKEYRRIEAVIEAARIPSVILRPTMIYGSQRDHNMHKLLRFLARYPVFPLVGGGRNLMQPVYAPDLAGAILAAVTRTHLVGAYNIAGPEPLPFRELIRQAAQALGRPARLVPVPLRLALWGVRLLELLAGRSPISSEQILRLQEDKAYDIGPAVNELGYRPTPFHEAIAHEVAALKEVNLL